MNHYVITYPASVLWPARLGFGVRKGKIIGTVGSRPAAQAYESDIC